MEWSRKNIVLCVVAVLLLAAPSLSWQLGTTVAEGPSATDGVLVLRNGQVLRGQITRLDNRYGVRKAEGSELRIAASDVDFLATSLDDACQRKLSRVRPGVAEDHIHLAEWCLRQGLIRQAAEATTEALRIAPNEPRVAGLERRLNALIQPPTFAASAATPSTPVHTNAQLDQAMRELSPGSMQRFTTHLQPLLLNRCALAGCHGSRATAAYRLQRPALGQSPNRRLTQHNLLATLAWVDPADPDESQLLAKAKAAHGVSTPTSPIEFEQGQYEQLVDWVRQVVRPALAIRPATIYGADPKLLQTAPDSPSNPAVDLRPSPPNPTAEKLTADRVTGAAATLRPAAKVAEPAASAADPFDPATFNRRRR